MLVFFGMRGVSLPSTKIGMIRSFGCCCCVGVFFGWFQALPMSREESLSNLVLLPLFSGGADIDLWLRFSSVDFCPRSVSVLLKCCGRFGLAFLPRLSVRGTSGGFSSVLVTLSGNSSKWDVNGKRLKPDGKVWSAKRRSDSKLEPGVWEVVWRGIWDLSSLDEPEPWRLRRHDNKLSRFRWSANSGCRWATLSNVDWSLSFES